MAASIIELRGVHKHYGAIRAVDGVDLALAPGGIVGVIGRNGAGKSTLFKLMLGLIEASAGDIRIGGEVVTGPAFRNVRRTIGYLPENVVFYDNLTGLETLRYFASLKSVPSGECPPLLERVGLAAAADQRVRGYSKGMRQRLAFAQSLLGRPRLLFLDEPTNGLDPEGVREFYALLGELRAEGVTILLTSHILAEIQERVDRLAILRQGRLQALGTLGELRGALDLPLRLHVLPREASNDRLREALNAASAAVGGNLRTDGAGYVIECPLECKLAVLHELSALRAALADIQVHEPSLEDLFLGYAR